MFTISLPLMCMCTVGGGGGIWPIAYREEGVIIFSFLRTYYMDDLLIKIVNIFLPPQDPLRLNGYSHDSKHLRVTLT